MQSDAMKYSRALWRGMACLGLVAALAACASSNGGRGALHSAVADPAPIVSGTMRPYQVGGRWYRPAEQPDYDEVGLASWYGAQHDGRPTATGEIFDMHAFTAAHKTLPLPGLVEVTNLENGRQAIVRINDRGPFAENRIIDLSRAAAEELGLLSRGVGRVRVRYVGQAPRAEADVLSSGKRSEMAATRSRVEAATIWVQAGIYASRAEAQYVANRLGEGSSVSQGGERWRVMLGPWSDANSAERARQAAIARGCPDALLISGV